MESITRCWARERSQHRGGADRLHYTLIHGIYKHNVLVKRGLRRAVHRARLPTYWTVIAAQMRLLPARLRRRLQLDPEADDIVFGQQHLGTRNFFKRLTGEWHSVPLSAFPHLALLQSPIEDTDEEHLYLQYLKASWHYVYPKERNTLEARMSRVNRFRDQLERTRRTGDITEPVLVTPRPDGRWLLVDGNHSASIAKHLGLSLDALEVHPVRFLTGRSKAPTVFYGSKRFGLPYQSIFQGKREMVIGRRRDILERLDLLGHDVIDGKRVLELGVNIGANSFAAAERGAVQTVGLDLCPQLVSAAIRLNAYFGLPCEFHVCDLNERGLDFGRFDTVMCFSITGHLNTISGVADVINASKARHLCFEGHQNTCQEDFAVLFERLGRRVDVELVGYTRDGIHSASRSRPLFRCEISH